MRSIIICTNRLIFLRSLNHEGWNCRDICHACGTWKMRNSKDTKQIWVKQCVKAWREINGLKKRSSGVLLQWTRCWTFGFHESGECLDELSGYQPSTKHYAPWRNQKLKLLGVLNLIGALRWHFLIWTDSSYVARSTNNTQGSWAINYF